jgi:hypothetical protein
MKIKKKTSHTPNISSIPSDIIIILYVIFKHILKKVSNHLQLPFLSCFPPPPQMAVDQPSPSLSDLWTECSAIASRRSFELSNVSECLDQWRADLETSSVPVDIPDPTDLVAKCRYFESLEHGAHGLVTSAAINLQKRVRSFARYASILKQDISRIRNRADLEAEMTQLDKRMQFYEDRPGISSRIIHSIPITFSVLNGQVFNLLYRGSDDGFGAAQFHAKCDRRPNTVTFVKTSDGYVFGGFTPLSWDSVSGFKCDENREGFVFTLDNPNHLQPKIFPLKEGQKKKAICCRGSAGPIFGGYDICIADKCNEDEVSYSNWLGYSYENDTGIPGTEVLAGKRNFKVSEIEVFEVSH